MAKFLDSAGLTYLWGKIQQSINEQIAVNVRLEVVQALPASGEGNIIYLVPGQTTATSNIYDEYIWTGTPGAWEKIGTTATDLSNYATTSDLNSAVQTINGSISDINTYIGSGYSSGSLTEAINDLFGIVGDGDSNWTLTEKINDLIQAIGDPNDTSSDSTVYGAIADLRDDVETAIGTSSDVPGASTVYGAINSVDEKIGDPSDTTSDSTVYGAIAGKANASHTHVCADITDLGALTNAEIDTAIAAYVPSGN